jgi:ribonuclease P/MRP protein subunit RPP1
MKDLNLFKEKDSVFLKRIKSKLDISPNDKSEGYLIDASEKEVRRIIDSLKGKNKIIGVVGGDNNFNRRAIEILKIRYLVSPERGEKRDTLKQRDSGLNHVLAKEAAKQKISVVIDMNEISKLSGLERSARIKRIIQNIKVCRKAKCDLKIASLATDSSGVVDVKGRSAIGVSFGMSSEQSRDAVRF